MKHSRSVFRSRSACNRGLLILAIYAASTLALADRVGNGGVGVVCRNTAEHITHAETLDLFEGKNQYNLTYATSELDLDTRIDIAQTRMVSNQAFLTSFQTQLAQVRSKIVFLPHNVGLEPTNDAFPIIHQRGCKFEQIANYSEDGSVYVDREIFDALDGLNQAALYVHEAVYALARAVAGDTSSVRSRKLTAYVMAQNSSLPVIQALMTDLSTSPTPPTPPVTNWAQMLREGEYRAEDPTRCAIRIDHLGTQDLLGTYAGNCRGHSTVMVYFHLGEDQSYSSSDNCENLLRIVRVVNPNTFISFGYNRIPGTVECDYNQSANTNRYSWIGN